MTNDYPNVLITKVYLEDLQKANKELYKDNEELSKCLLNIQEEFKKERTELMQIIQELCDIIKDSY